MSTTAAGGPLAGLRVIELAGLGPCPLAGQLLADLGADVVVIDRRSAPADPADVNRRGKRSVVLDLKSAEGREAVLRLAERSDVLIEGFRPGVMERLGLGPADVEARAPRLVYGRMTGWGQDGPLAHTAGHDIGYLALTGALAAIGPRERPVAPINLAADYAGGTMFLVFGVLAALFERERSGRGQVVDAAMVDGVPALMALVHSMLARGQWQERREANLLDGGAPFYRVYECADGRHVAVGALEPQFFAVLCEGLGIELPQYDTAAWPDHHERMAAVFRTRTRDEWAAAFEGTDACVAPVLSTSEAPDHPHMAARETFVRPGGVLQAAPAPRFARTPAPAPRLPRAHGADTDEVLAELGL